MNKKEKQSSQSRVDDLLSGKEENRSESVKKLIGAAKQVDQRLNGATAELQRIKSLSPRLEIDVVAHAAKKEVLREALSLMIEQQEVYERVCDSFQEERVNYQNTIDTLRGNIKIVLDKEQELHETIADIRNENAQLNNRMLEAEAQAESYRKSNACLREKEAKVSEDMERIREAYSDSQEETSDLSNRLRDANKEISRLQGVVGSTKIREEYASNLIKKNEKLAEQIEQWKNACGLETEDGDPDGVTPEAAKKYWEGVEAERNRLKEGIANEWRTKQGGQT